MKVPSFDLKEQYQELRQELLGAVDEVMTSGHFILGEQVKLLEREVAAYLGLPFGVGVANGSDAINLALMACGVGPGDEVIVPAFTFFATAGAVSRTGATPVFVDVDPRTFNIDVEQVAARITDRTKAIVPVHLYGQLADMEALVALASGRGIHLVEDGAQAIGATRNSRPVGSFGDFGTLSFFPTKNLGAFGDAGMVLTSLPENADRLRVLRAHGAKVKYHHDLLGYNSRLDELQAAVLRVKLNRLPEWTQKRLALAARYDRLLPEAGLGERILSPVVAPGNQHVYHQYTIVTERRDELQQYLAEAGVGTAVYYPVPLHLQPVFHDLGYKAGDLPVSERLCATALSLPMFPELGAEQQEYVVDQIRQFFSRGVA